MAAQAYTPFEDQIDDRNADILAIPMEEKQNNAARGYSGPQVDLDQICPPRPATVSQPISQSFNPNVFDPVSRVLYDSLPRLHMSHESLLSSVHDGGKLLNASVNAQFTSMKDNMTYSEMLSGLLYVGERVVQYNQFQNLNYKHIILSDENNSPCTEKDGGICLLTDKRLLLMSSQMNQSTSFKSFGDPKKMPGGYSIETSFGDTTCYLPIPLKFFKSVELNGRSGIKGKIMVHPQAPCCCGLCGICGITCGISAFLKQWINGLVRVDEHNEMTISIGVLMPPWGRRMFLHIHVDNNVPMPVIRDFISLLQKYAIHLN